jgi:hypothetical protein
MTLRALTVATGLFALSMTPAMADAVTAAVAEWDAAKRTLTLEDQSQFTNIPAAIAIPNDLEPGMEVTVDYNGTEDGVASYNSVTVNRDVARRPVPNKRG